MGGDAAKLLEREHSELTIQSQSNWGSAESVLKDFSQAFEPWLRAKLDLISHKSKLAEEF